MGMTKIVNWIIVSSLTLSTLGSLGARAADPDSRPATPLVLSDDEAKNLRQIMTEAFRSGPTPSYSVNQIDHINQLIQGGKPLPSYIQLYGPTEGENPNLAVFTLNGTPTKKQVTLDTTVPAFVRDMNGDAKNEGRSKNADGSQGLAASSAASGVAPAPPVSPAGSAR